MILYHLPPIKHLQDLVSSKETIEAHLESLNARESELISQYNEASESLN